MSTEISTEGIVPRFSSQWRVPILRPAQAGSVISRDPVSMIRDCPLEDVHGSRSGLMVLNRAEDTSRFDRDQPHTKLASGHPVDLVGQFDGLQDLDRDPLHRMHLALAHPRKSSEPLDPGRELGRGRRCSLHDQLGGRPGGESHGVQGDQHDQDVRRGPRDLGVEHARQDRTDQLGD